MADTYLNILLVMTSPLNFEEELIVAEDRHGELYWAKTDFSVYVPGDAILAEDTNPLEDLSEDEREAVLEAVASAV